MENVWALVSAILAGIVLIGNASEKIAKAVRIAKAPNDTQNDRLDALEQRMDAADRKFSNDKERIDSLERGTHASQRALLALLGHGLHGNNVKQMEDAEDELKTYLINR